MAHLILARHAQASFGTADYDRLSELGVRQSQWLGEYFRDRGLQFHRVVTGSLLRQRDTARHVLAAMGQPDATVHEDAGLNEYLAEGIVRAHMGEFDPAELQRRDYREYWRMFRTAMAAWSAGSLVNEPESWDDFGARVNGAIANAVLGAGRNDTVLIVSSGGAIGRAVSDILGAPAATAIELNLQFRNAAFCELIAGRDSLRIISTNNIPHLDTAGRREFITAA